MTSAGLKYNKDIVVGYVRRYTDSELWLHVSLPQYDAEGSLMSGHIVNGAYEIFVDSRRGEFKMVYIGVDEGLTSRPSGRRGQFVPSIEAREIFLNETARNGMHYSEALAHAVAEFKQSKELSEHYVEPEKHEDGGTAHQHSRPERDEPNDANREVRGRKAADPLDPRCGECSDPFEDALRYFVR